MQALDWAPAATDPEHWIREHAEAHYLVPVRMFMAFNQT